MSKWIVLNNSQAPYDPYMGLQGQSTIATLPALFQKQGISEPPSNPPDPSRAYFFSVAEYLELSVAENPQNVKATFTSQLVDFQ